MSKPHVVAVEGSWINGDPAASLDLNSRAFNFGDGLFETLLVLDGRPMLLDLHWQRLVLGCSKLQLALDEKALRGELNQVLSGLPAGLVRLKMIVSRIAGTAPGYGSSDDACDRIIQVFPASSPVNNTWQNGISLSVAEHRLSLNRQTAGIKHLNRLDQVLAARGLSQDADRLMLDQNDSVIETVAANVFIYVGGHWLTPALDCAGVNGVVREWVLAKYPQIRCGAVTLVDIENAEAIFLTNSIKGVWPVNSFEGRVKSLHHSEPLNFIRQLQKQFLQELGLNA